jgi:hypothetical protein
MVADPKMYDEMALDEADADPDEADETAADEADTGDEIDEDFRLAAEAAGMTTPAKVEAFKRAIERCVELRDQNAYVPEEGETETDDVDLEV